MVKALLLSKAAHICTWRQWRGEGLAFSRSGLYRWTDHGYQLMWVAFTGHFRQGKADAQRPRWVLRSKVDVT